MSSDLDLDLSRLSCISHLSRRENYRNTKARPALPSTSARCLNGERDKPDISDSSGCLSYEDFRRPSWAIPHLMSTTRRGDVDVGGHFPPPSDLGHFFSLSCV